MSAIQLHTGGALAYREARADGPESGDAVVCVHGFPESSRMWIALMEALAAGGRRSVAPDLYCLGDSDDPGPATFERSLEQFSEWLDELALGRIALVVHDWGGFIGLAWACEHPDLVSALVIADAGFFADGKWHGVAKGLRSDAGEEVMAAIDRAGFAALLRADGAPFTDEDVDAYWRPFAEGRGREATLEFYRSMDFEKLAPYEGKLADLGVPTLLVWGADDQFAPLSGAERFLREIPGARLAAFEGAGHFVFDQVPARSTREVADFLAAIAADGNRGD
jgi:haloalkane dehalogenase